MGWDPERKGHYCARCDVAIQMSVRQERFRGKYGEGSKASDPYVAINRHAFWDDRTKPVIQDMMYCFDCEPIIIAALEAINKEARAIRAVERIGIEKVAAYVDSLPEQIPVRRGDLEQIKFFLEGVPTGVPRGHPEEDPQWGIRRLETKALVEKILKRGAQ